MAVLTRIGRRALQWIDGLLQALVPPLASRIGYASIPDFSDNAYYVFAHALRTRHDLEHVWFVQDAASAARVHAQFAALTADSATRGHRLRVERWHSVAGYWRFLRCISVFHTHGVYNFSRSAVRRQRIGLWHGMPIKCIGRLNRITPNPNPQFATHHVATSWFFRYVLATAFDMPVERVLMLGQPRNDVLAGLEPATLPATSVQAQLGLQAGERLLIWMPTYRAEGRALHGSEGRPLRSFVDDIAPDLLAALAVAARTRRCRILVKLHPYERADIRAALAAHPEFQVLDDAQWRSSGIALYDLLAASDALISDVSSVLIDYVVSGKPVACLGFDARAYTRDLVFPIERLLDPGGIEQIGDRAGLARFFDAIDAGSRPVAAAYDWFVARFEQSASEALARIFIDHAVPSSNRLSEPRS